MLTFFDICVFSNILKQYALVSTKKLAFYSIFMISPIFVNCITKLEINQDVTR